MISKIEVFLWFTGFKVEVTVFTVFAPILDCTNLWFYELCLKSVECNVEMYIPIKTCVNSTRKN